MHLTAKKVEIMPTDLDDVSEASVLTLIWHITKRCNLLCKYCSTNSSIKADYGPSHAEAKRIVDMINRSEVAYVSLIGGEPLIREDIIDIIMQMKDGIAISIDTNGILLQEKLKREVYNKIDHVNISVDGPSSIHNSMRGGYAKVIENMKWAVKNGIRVGSTITISEYNIDYLEQTVRELASIGVQTIGFNRIRGLGRNLKDMYSLGDDQGTLEKVKENAKLAKSLGVNKTIINGWYDYEEEDAPSDLEDAKLSCYCGMYRASLRWDGSLLPCNFLVYDNIYEKVIKAYRVPKVSEFNDIDEVLETDLFTDFRKATTETLPEGCDGCVALKFCSRGCRGESFAAGLGLDGPNVHCNRSLQKVNAIA